MLLNVGLVKIIPIILASYLAGSLALRIALSMKKQAANKYQA
jgi:hypothetical protein